MPVTAASDDDYKLKAPISSMLCQAAHIDGITGTFFEMKHNRRQTAILFASTVQPVLKEMFDLL